MSWIAAVVSALVIALLAFVVSRWLEKRHYAQQIALLERKKERLKVGDEASDDDSAST